MQAHACTQTPMHACACTYTCSPHTHHTCEYMGAHMHTATETPIHSAHTQSHMHTCTCRGACTQIHACTHTRTHRHAFCLSFKQLMILMEGANEEMKGLDPVSTAWTQGIPVRGRARLSVSASALVGLECAGADGSSHPTPMKPSCMRPRHTLVLESGEELKLKQMTTCLQRKI